MLPRSDGGEYLAALDKPRAGDYFNLIYETTIPTVKTATETAARIPEPQLEQERASDSKKPTSDGTQAVDCRITHETGIMPMRFQRAARIKEGRDFNRA